MLDLQVLQNKTFNIKMLDGRELRIKKLSKAQMFQMNDLDVQIQECKDIKEQFNLICKRVHFVLNNNLENIKITMKEIEALDFAMLTAINQEYAKFIYEVANNPN